MKEDVQYNTSNHKTGDFMEALILMKFTFEVNVIPFTKLPIEINHIISKDELPP